MKTDLVLIQNPQIALRARWFISILFSNVCTDFPHKQAFISLVDQEQAFFVTRGLTKVSGITQLLDAYYGTHIVMIYISSFLYRLFF